MKVHIELHHIQSETLQKLLFLKDAKFSDLNPLGIPSDQFNFHLKQLIIYGLVEKDDENGKYKLSIEGKNFLNRYDAESNQIIKQAMNGVMIVCVDKSTKPFRYLVQKRLKQPYFGYYGFISGKIKWGENVETSARREFFEETNLLAKFKLKKIVHKKDFDNKENLIEDIFFFIFEAFNYQGELKRECLGGENSWMSKGEILKLDKLFLGVKETFKYLNTSNLTLSEVDYNINNY